MGERVRKGEGCCVYVAGPINAPNIVGGLDNIGRMLTTAFLIKKAGHYPYFPAWDVLLAFAFPGQFDYEDYFRGNTAWLMKADVMFVIAPSPGTNREVEMAEDRGIPILRTLPELALLRKGANGQWVLMPQPTSTRIG